jgi:medium-chain acyl-[acyl-carrier-protein] hydrolase
MMRQSTLHSPWIVRPRPNPAASMRLFCLPYAGGGASLYRAWAGLLPAEIELCAIQLPGREQRIGDPAYTTMTELVAELAEQLDPWVADLPYALFGHSLGALVAYELAQELRANAAGPRHLFVSASPPPPSAGQRRPIHTLPDSQFIAELRRLKGTPEEVLQHRELMELLLPVLRADFTLLNTYTPRQQPPLPCPIAAFAGVADQEIPADVVQRWQEHTAASFRLRVVPGDHFFLHSAGPALIQAIRYDLAPALRPASPAAGRSV